MNRLTTYTAAGPCIFLHCNLRYNAALRSSAGLFLRHRRSPQDGIGASNRGDFLFMARRLQGTSPPPSRPVKYVATKTSDPAMNENDPSYDDFLLREVLGTVSTDNLHPDAAAATATKSNEAGQTVDFTSKVGEKKLERLYRPSRHRQMVYLSPPERSTFTKMIHDQFYKEEGQTERDPAMEYQASLEIKWIEEWASKQAVQKNLTLDETRRLVKTSLLERVDLHKPLSYIIGSQPFFGCDITCRPPLLCPRPETEMWTHWLVYRHLSQLRASAHVAAAAPPRFHVLDVCCGTGCIGIALAKHVPMAYVTAVDILPAAVATSRDNASQNGIEESRYHAICSDMFTYFLDEEAAEAPTLNAEVAPADGKPAAPPAATLPHVLPQGMEEQPMRRVRPDAVGTVDLIVSNPPYVLPDQYVALPRTITHWESKTALVGDDFREQRQYLYFKELCIYGAQLLKPRHKRHESQRDAPNIVIEVGLQARIVASLMEQSGLWERVEVHLDYSQQQRWITATSIY